MEQLIKKTPAGEAGFKNSQLVNQSTEVAASVARQVAEVQASMVIAKQFPRDEAAAYTKIMEACHRPALAEQATYSYPKGGQKVSGPSIRLAEVLARAWGNMDYGITEVEQRHGESTMEAFAWDKETNTRSTKRFTVKHQRSKTNRQTGQKEVTILDDSRDVYEMNANMGSRRMRACILAIIPGDLVDAAVAECNNTLVNGSNLPLADQIKQCVAAFKELGVTQEEIEGRLGSKMKAATPQDMADLRGIYNSINNGMSKKDQWFTPVSKFEMETENTADKPKKTTKKKAEPEAVDPKNLDFPPEDGEIPGL
jgi:hypothetical protein